MSLAIMHFYNKKSKPKEPAFLLVLFGFSLVNTDGRLNGESFHQTVKLFLRERPGFICASRPLVYTIGEALHDHAETVLVKTDALDTVSLVSAEEEEGSFLHRIQTIFEADNGHET